MSEDKEVFLGGTTNKSNWRTELVSQLTMKSFNPVVENWNAEAQEIELQKRASCDYVLYVITAKMEGVYSIAEVVDDSNKRPEKTLFCVLPEDEGYIFTIHQAKSLEMTARMVQANGAKVFRDLKSIAQFLNAQ